MNTAVIRQKKMVISPFVFKNPFEEGKDIETKIKKRPYLAVFSPSVIQTLELDYFVFKTCFGCTRGYLPNNSTF